MFYTKVRHGRIYKIRNETFFCVYTLKVTNTATLCCGYVWKLSGCKICIDI